MWSDLLETRCITLLELWGLQKHSHSPLTVGQWCYRVMLLVTLPHKQSLAEYRQPLAESTQTWQQPSFISACHQLTHGININLRYDLQTVTFVIFSGKSDGLCGAKHWDTACWIFCVYVRIIGYWLALLIRSIKICHDRHWYYNLRFSRDFSTL